MKVNFTPSILVAGLAIALLTQIPVQAQTISTVAGGGSAINVQAVNFGFSYPIFAVQYAPTGDIYVNLNGEGAIRKISSSGVVTLVAGGNGTGEIPDGPVTGTGIFPNLTGLVVDATGNLYITEFSSCKVRKISTSGTISTIAGTGTPGFSGDGGAATAAQLNFPFGLAIDATGNIYVADMFNNRVRKISTGGIITTVAGSATSGSGGDGGAATSAQLNQPEGLAVDGSGNLYIADVNNNKIRKVTTGGIISTYAGTGIYGSTGDGGPATSATLSSPATVSFDGSGNLYIMDGNTKVRKVTLGGTISTVAGNGTQGFSGDNGPATSAELQGAFGTLVDASGNLLICDESNQRIRKVTPGGTITTFAGNGGNYIGNNGPATSAVLTLPDAVYTDHAGNIYFPDKNTVLRVDAVTGTITTFAGTGGTYSATDGYPAISQPVWSPFGVWGDQAGNIYIGCSGDYTVRKVDPSGIMTKFAGIAGTNGYTGDGGPAVNAAIGHPQGITGDPAGNIYITDFDHNVVRKVTPGGIISTFAGGGAAYGDGGPATSAQLGAPNSICVDAAGNIYVANDFPNSVRKIDPSGTITTVAGGNNSTTGNTGDGGPATAALFGDIEGLTCDAIGNLYITDGQNHLVRRVDASTGIISPFAGTGVAGFSGDNGPASAAQLHGPWAASMDGQGNVYVGDAQNLRIRKITIPYTLPTVNTTVTQTINGTLSADVNDNSFHRLVTVTPTGGVNALAGSVVFGLSFDGSIQLFNGHPYAMRHYDITPAANASTSQATVLLYFTQADFDAYNNYVSTNHLGLPVLPVNAADVSDMGNITILQFHGTGTAPANYTGGAEMITPTVHFNAVNNWWEISFPVNGFSGFFLTSGIVPLPLHLLSFSGLLQGGNVTLDWKTADEKGTKLFSVERSSNAKDFVSIGQVAAKDVAGVNSYQYVDQSVAAGAWYYRLRMQDIDGKYTYSNVISVNVGAAFQGMLVYPNPVADRLFVQLQSTQVEKTVVRLVDMQGKTLQQQEVMLSNGVTSFTFDTRTLARGTYFISVAGSRPQIRQFVKP